MTSVEETTRTCERCGARGAHKYEIASFGAHGEPHEAHAFTLCVRCARSERKQMRGNEPEGLIRKELIAHLDEFFAASGVFDICRRCHQQSTGCCPPACRVMGASGCDPNNSRGKTVFCAAFVCSALLNAIAECDPAIGRELRWIKRELGAPEFHIYEMITRVPGNAREPVRPLALPRRYPAPVDLDGEKIRARLNELADEVLELRRRWREQELQESA